jgi:hypothetical protein
VRAGLRHDIGKVFGGAGHGPIAAALLEPHVRPMSSRRSVTTLSSPLDTGEPDRPARPTPGTGSPRSHGSGLACQLVDEWDMKSFDPTYDSLPLNHFIPLVQRRIREP